MLNAQTIATVKVTIPLPVEAGLKLTTHFYDRVFTYNPELEEIFDMSNQRDGDQRKALLNATVAYASNTENPAALLPTAEKIAQKYISFQIKPGQYNIVGGYLLVTLDKMFSPGQEILDMWDKAYGVLTNIFINREAQIYSENANENGGWEGTRPSRTVAKISRNVLITSFEFEPVDDGAVAEYRPGQYLGVWLKPEGFPHQGIRQHSLTREPSGKGYCTVVKREDGGQVSTWLRSHTNVGDIIHPAAPAGDFFMSVATDIPVPLISAGVEQTPMLVMLDTLAKVQHAAQVNWFHVAEDSDVHAFADEVNELGETLPCFNVHTWYCEPTKADHAKGAFDSVGLMDLNKLKSVVNDPVVQFCLCGPASFMQFAAKQLVGLGVENENTHYECLDPHRVSQCVTRVD